MDKFKYLVGYGLKKRVVRKAFLISNIIVFIVTVALINFPNLISLFSSDSNKEVVYNIDFYNATDEDNFKDDFSALLNYNLVEDMFILNSPLTDFEEEEFWEDKEKDIAIIIDGTIKEPNVIIYTDDPVLFQNLKRALELLIISYQVENYVEPQINISLPPDYESPEDGMILSSIMNVLVLPMFILIIMATQFVGVDIIEEKSTKAIETIISSVPAKTHFFSKIISSVLFVIIQGALMLGFGLVGILISRLFGSITVGNNPVPGVDQGDFLTYISTLITNWPVVLVVSLLFMIIGTLLYLVFAALLASMAVTQEDYQQFQTPIMLILLGSFYASMFGPMLGADTFVKVLSFIPFVAPMIAPVAYASGLISLPIALISLLILIISLIAFTYLFIPVYRVSILSYEQTKFFRRTKDYFKQGFRNKNNK